MDSFAAMFSHVPYFIPSSDFWTSCDMRLFTVNMINTLLANKPTSTWRINKLKWVTGHDSKIVFSHINLMVLVDEIH